MITSWNIGHFVLSLELVFSYSLSTIKVFTNSSLDYELTIKFADPTDFKFVGNTFLAFGAISAIVVAWLADAYTGKFYISLVGVACVAGSATFWTLFQWYLEDGVPNYTYMFFANVLVGMYFPTSSVRNVLLLEQFRLPSELHNIRDYIFVLVMMRVGVRFICRSVIVFDYTAHDVLKKLCPIVVFFSLFYLVILLLIGGKLHLEATYYRIWELSLRCFIIAIIRKRSHDIKMEKLRNKKLAYTTPAKTLKVKNSKDLDNIGIRPENEEVIQKTKRWGFRGILAENMTSTQRIDMEPGKTQKFFDWLFAFVPISVNYADIVNTYTPKEEIVEPHWMYTAVPSVSMYVANQTRRLLPVIFAIIPAFSVGNLMYFIILLSVRQTKFLFKAQTFNYPMIDLVTISVVFDLLLIPFFEILVYPRLKKLQLKDLQYLFIGYAVLMIALFHGFGVQVQVESTHGYLPQPNFGQIRMYNFLSSTTAVHLNVLAVERIGYLDVFTYSLRIVDKSKLDVRIVNDDLGMDKNFAIDIVPGETISYIIDFQTISYNGDDFDPTIFSADAKRGVSTFLIVSPFKYFPYKLNFKNVEDTTKSYTFEFARGVRMEIPPGLYNVIGEKDNGNRTLFKTANLEDACLYAFLVYNNPRESTYSRFLLLEGPKNISQLRILIHVFLMNLANAIISVSFYRYLFLESPPKLRGATFTFLYALNVLGFIFLNIIFNLENRISFSNIIIIYALVHIFIFMLTVYYANKYQYRYPIT